MAYDKNKDYQEEINKAVAKGDYATASTLEKQRNEKIEAENLSYDKTNNYTIPNGVDGATYNKMQSSYTPSASVSEGDALAGKALYSLDKIINKGQIISGDVMAGMNSQFVVPAAVTEADAYLSEQLKKIQSGKTSYSDQVQSMMDKIMNREKFSYDIDADPLFQQALASSMKSGQQAMQDTIGQASALTGGYGSTYATSAGNQAYNAFIEDAYNNLPQYYQMAMEAYQMEGDEMYRQFGMLSELDDKEYNRNVTAYDATYAHRNQMYNEAYTQYRDSKSDAFAMANIQIAEHGQRVSDAYNLYSATSDYANTLYEREYSQWADEVNMAYKYADMLNTDWWNQTNFDEGVRQYEQSFAEEQRQYNESLAEDKRQYDMTYQQNEDHFTRGQEFQSSESQKQRDWQTSESATQREWQSSESQKQRDWQSSESQKDRDFTATENAKNRSSGGGGGSGGSGSSGSKKSGSDNLKTPTENQMKKALDAYNEEGMDGLNKYLNSVSDDYDREAIATYAGQYGVLPYSQRTYTVTDDGGTNWGWGIDNNAKVKDQYGNEFTLEQLAEHDKDLAKELSDKKYTKGSTYTKK